jgi:hypothetical protein
MTVVSVTRLHVRSWRFFLPFLIYTMRSGSQAKRSPGFRGGTLGNDAQFGNWTITLWDSEEAMRGFRNSGAHRVAMPKLLNWCDEASYTHYTTDESEFPSPDAAYRRLSAGKISKVNQPSAAHAQGRTVSAGIPRFALTLRPR